MGENKTQRIQSCIQYILLMSMLDADCSNLIQTCNLNCSMTKEKHERFEKAFSAPSVQHIYIGDISFVMLNSMALEGDGCRLCREAEKQLEKIYQQLKCSQVLLMDRIYQNFEY